MADLKKIQSELSTSRTERAELELSLQNAKQKLFKLEAKKKNLKRTASEDELKEELRKLQREKENLEEQIGRDKVKKKSLDERINVSIGEIFETDPVRNIEKLDDSYPFMLFPLRLETRFKIIDNQNQLWIRVYPDDCHINMKNEFLSDSELKNAKNFWIEMWKAGGIEESERGAWRSLVNSHGSGRASWIIEKYKPTNSNPPSKANKDDIILTIISDPDFVLTASEETAANNYWIAFRKANGDAQKQNAAFTDLKNATSNVRAAEIVEKYKPVNILDPIPAGKSIDDLTIQVAKLELPAHETINTSTTSWTQAPRATALPDRFTAICYTGNNSKTFHFTNPVSDNLPVGPDPSLPENEQIKSEDGELKINDEIKWMVDFEEAIKVGMGIKINLTAQEATSGFDKLFVVGLRLSSDESSAKKIIEKLFADHYLSKDGMGLIKQGTPTNNTEDEDSGFTWLDNSDESYDRIFKHSENFDEKNIHTDKSDGQRLAEYLGLDNEIFNTMPNANGKDQIESIAMNKALFNATLGYFMEEMMTPVFDDNDIADTKSFFTNFVSGRGPVPAIRIGKQPYGILPACAFSQMQFYESDRLFNPIAIGSNRSRFLIRLHGLISKIDLTWDNLVSKVLFVGNGGDAHQILLDVISLQANSVEFYQRYSESLQQLYNHLSLFFLASKGNALANMISQRGKVILKELGFDVGDLKIPILEKFFLSKPNLLSGPLVDDVPSSEIIPIREYSADHKNYLEWLASSDPEKIRTLDFGGNPSPAALLFLLLRHSLMLATSNAGVNALVRNQVLADKKLFYDPAFINIESNGGGKSKFEHLYSVQPKVTGSNDKLLVDHLYTPAVLNNSPDTKNLKETIDSIKLLEKTPTARLERLLIEHFDCCNYRIDAWKTGLINYKLIEQREIKRVNDKPSKGLYIGAYGWLHDVKPENKILSDAELTDELKGIFEKDGIPPKVDDKNLGYIHAPSLNQASTAAILRNAYVSNSSTVPDIENSFSINLTSDRVRLANNFLEGVRNGQSLSALLGYRFERGLHDKHNLGKGEVDKFIFPLRKKFPLVADNLVDTKTDNEESIEVIEARNVIDGMKLIKHVRALTNKSYPFGFSVGSNPGDLPIALAKEIAAIDEEVVNIQNINDAVSDMVMAEGVYQVVQGNFERASGNADAYSKGTYPPEIEVANTPRTGITITQRVAVQFDTSADKINSPLPGISMSIRSKAEAPVNKWLSEILPDPAKVLCKISYTNPLVTDKPEIISQKDLNLQPIDLLYLFNVDSEQSMTALDDIIMNYVRYELSKHSNTSLKIDYLSSIDDTDKTKISFFETAALIKSLRKILVESRFLSPLDLILPAGNETTTADFDSAELKLRILEIKNGVTTLLVSLLNISTTVFSIAGLTKILETELKAVTADTNQINSLLTQFGADLKESVLDSSIINSRTADFRTKLTAFITDINTLNDLELLYKDSLDDFVNDHPKFDDLAETFAKKFSEINLTINAQTGIGFLYDGISGIYKSFFTKLDKIIERWEKKVLDFDALIVLYNNAATDDERFEHLKKAESKISFSGTFPLPNNHVTYKNIINVKKNDFDNHLNDLKNLKSSNKEKVIDFFNVAEPVIKKIELFDTDTFDKESDTNDVNKEKRLAISLKEDIMSAVTNLASDLGKRIDDADDLISASDESATGIEKVNQLLLAAKKLMGDDALMLPHFKLEEKRGLEFEKAFGDSDAILDYSKTSQGKVFPVEDWLFGTARVREKLANWENIIFLSQGFKETVSMELTPLQFPYLDDDRWLALKFRDVPAEYEINTDKLLYTAHFAKPFDVTKTQTGVLIDDWTELIPGIDETTGISFHYDQPNSEPPQAILLVAPPIFTGQWKWSYITGALEETFEMMKKRAVEPAHIEETGYAQFLPTTMMAVTLYFITVSMNLAMNNNFYSKLD